MPDAAPAPATGTGTATGYKRIVFKVWRSNGIVCDNAAEVDYLLRTGWQIKCTENLSADHTEGSVAVLYILEPVTPTPVSPPVITVPTPDTAPNGATTVALACSITRGRMLIQALDDPKALAFPVGPAPASTCPAPAAGFITLPFTLNGSASPRYIGVFCINDSAPLDWVPAGWTPPPAPPAPAPAPPPATVLEAPYAVFHAEVSFLAGGQVKTVVKIDKDEIPSGTTRVYYFVINPPSG